MCSKSFDEKQQNLLLTMDSIILIFFIYLAEVAFNELFSFKGILPVDADRSYEGRKYSWVF
jgi:hypothetical protein